MLRRLADVPAGVRGCATSSPSASTASSPSSSSRARPLNQVVVDRYPLVDADATEADLADYTNWALDVYRQVERAVDAIHARGVVYGDLHLFNIMVRPDDAVALVDFEVAAPADEPTAAGSAQPGLRRPARPHRPGRRPVRPGLPAAGPVPAADRAAAAGPGQGGPPGRPHRRALPGAGGLPGRGGGHGEPGTRRRCAAPTRSPTPTVGARRRRPADRGDPRQRHARSGTTGSSPATSSSSGPAVGWAWPTAPRVSSTPCRHRGRPVPAARGVAGRPGQGSALRHAAAASTTACTGSPTRWSTWAGGADALELLDVCLRQPWRRLGTDLIGGLPGIGAQPGRLRRSHRRAGPARAAWRGGRAGRRPARRPPGRPDDQRRTATRTPGCCAAAPGRRCAAAPVRAPGDPALLDHAATALRHDLRRCVVRPDGALEVNEGWRTMPYLGRRAASASGWCSTSTSPTGPTSSSPRPARRSAGRPGPVLRPVRTVRRPRRHRALPRARPPRAAATDVSRRTVRRLAWHALPYADGLAFPGEQLLRLSMDLGHRHRRGAARRWARARTTTRSTCPSSRR